MLRPTLLFRFCALAIAAMLLTVAPLAQATKSPTADADALFAASDWEGAQNAYAALVKADSSLGAAWFGMGRASIQLSQYDRAHKAFKKSLDLGFRPPLSMFGIARSMAGQGKQDKAIEWLGKLSETGFNGYGLALRTPEINQLSDHPGYAQAMHGLRPCRSPEHRQFDFWLGDWDVKGASTPPEQPPSHNRISSTQGGCVVLEEYDTPGGYTGVSLNFYDPNKQQWHQTWMDNQGAPILHSGGLVDGSMVLLDDPDGQIINRTTWTPLDKDRVRQHWELSNDGGKTWRTLFDGMYTRRKE